MHRVLELTSYEGTSSLRLSTRERPALQAGDVLVRTLAAPVNPSDTAFIRGLYAAKKPLPTVPGLEGSGVVVEGRGIGRALVGRRVAFSAPPDGDGSWSELVRTKATMCFPLKKGVPDEQGATLIVNPLTAWSFLLMAKAGGHRAIVHTAAASSLGRWLIRLAREQGVTVLNVVRGAANADALRALGEQHVFDSNQADMDRALKDACRSVGASLAFDAVAGETSMRVLNALAKGGTLCSYGALSESPTMQLPGDLIFDDKRVVGFWLPRFFSLGRLPSMLRGAGVIQRHMASGATTTVRERVDLGEMPLAIDRYVAQMSDGKVLFTPPQN